METNILKQILFGENGYWDAFISKHRKKIRPVVVREVEKLRKCRDPRNGFKHLVCKGCHDIKRVPYRCKGRFCTTCSCGETEEWSRVMCQEVFQVNHRHVVFTIDEGLWEVFLLHRKLMKLIRRHLNECEKKQVQSRLLCPQRTDRACSVTVRSHYSGGWGLPVPVSTPEKGSNNETGEGKRSMLHLLRQTRPKQKDGVSRLL